MVPNPGDLLLLDDPDVEGGVTQHAVLDVLFEVEERPFLIGGDPSNGEIDFAPYPVIFTMKDGLLLGADEAVSIRGIVEGGARAETLIMYRQLREDVERAEEHCPSDDEYEVVAEQQAEIVDQITALTIYGDVLVTDGTVRAAALLEAIGIPLPEEEKLILLGLAFNNLDALSLDFTDPEDDEDADVDA